MTLERTTLSVLVTIVDVMNLVRSNAALDPILDAKNFRAELLDLDLQLQIVTKALMPLPLDLALQHLMLAQAVHIAAFPAILLPSVGTLQRSMRMLMISGTKLANHDMIQSPVVKTLSKLLFTIRLMLLTRPLTILRTKGMTTPLHMPLSRR